MQTLFFLGQIVLGAYFIMAGTRHFTNLAGMTGYATSKKLPMPKLSVIVSGLALWLGGLGVLFQYSLVWAYGLLVAFLVLSAFWLKVCERQEREILALCGGQTATRGDIGWNSKISL